MLDIYAFHELLQWYQFNANTKVGVNEIVQITAPVTCRHIRKRKNCTPLTIFFTIVETAEIMSRKWSLYSEVPSHAEVKSQYHSFLAWDSWTLHSVWASPEHETVYFNAPDSDPHLLIILIRHYSALGVRPLLLMFSRVFCLEKQQLYYSLQIFSDCSQAGPAQSKTIIPATAWNNLWGQSPWGQVSKTVCLCTDKTWLSESVN